ncbi:MAG: nitrous oxide reductase accessory protein NosL [Phycisphaerales bacterium]|nr:nitrous oxide reductase accessory protein NosL [Phycisphaerales bacterium]
MRVTMTMMMTAVVVLALTGCDRPAEEITAPRVHYGQDVCAECSMIISDDRFAGAIGLRRDGRIVHLLFDDVGEMLAFDPGPNDGIRWFATDASTSAWLDAEAAVFLRSEKLMTPMGTGVGAYATRDAAERARTEYGGEILAFDAFRPARAGG